MGHSTGSGRVEPGMKQARLDEIIGRVQNQRNRASRRQIADFAMELDAMNVGDKIVEIDRHWHGGAQDGYETSRTTTYTRTQDGWSYSAKTSMDSRTFSGNVSTESLADSILFDARRNRDTETWRVRR